jgi:hypothetical protein
MTLPLPKSFTILLSTLLFAFLFSSCEEDPSFGIDLLPEEDKVNGFFDNSTQLSGFTFLPDSIRTDEGIYSSARSFNLLGSYLDPVFGLTQADFLTETRLSSNLVNFGDTMVSDSLILYLKIGERYGEFRQFHAMNINIYKLKDTISLGLDYYSNLDVNPYYDPSELLASYTYYPSNGDSILAIPLDTTLLLPIFRNPDAMVDNDTFRLHMPGFYITSETVNQGGQILSFDMLNESSRMVLYFHYLADEDKPILPATSTRRFNFLINQNCARINRFAHDYNQAWYPIQHIGDSLSGDSVGYIQGTGGVKIQLNLSDFNHWKDSTDVVIVKADLIIPIVENSALFFDPPAVLALSRLADSTNEFLGDQYHNGTYYTDYFDGKFYASQQEYHFNVAQHLQDIILGNVSNDPLILHPYNTENAVRANRTLINYQGIKLNIQYLK